MAFSEVRRHAMANKWLIKGPEIVSCTCDFGCPCQFNSLPTAGHCHAAAGIRIDEGYFDGVRLDGLKCAVVLAWPKAIHLGHGQALPIVDERADEKQRQALLTIMSGKASTPGATFFDVFASTYEKVHDPLFKPIHFEVDIEARTGRFEVPGVISCSAVPLRNAVTNAPHRARINLPNGFEYRTAEIASGSLKTRGPIKIEFENRHCHLAMLNIGPDGPIA
jgi:hypothetical protein